MCDNSRTWVFNFALVVVAVALTVTAPLIQHVACVANEQPRADIANAVVTAAQSTSLVKRDVGNVGSSESVAEDNDGRGRRRRIVRDRDVDFDAYVNEFDIQEEASIPEDILDQQHIDDGDAQYATESEASDIVFESPQQLFPKNFTSYIAVSKHNNNDENNNKDNNNNNNFNIKNNKKNNKNNDKISTTNKMEEEYYADMAIVGDEQSSTEGEDIVKQEENMDMNSSGSVVYKKFKRMKTQKNEQHRQKQHEEKLKLNQEQEQEQNVDDDVEEENVEEGEEQDHEKHQKQLSAIVKLNERKFNKVSMKQPDPKQKTKSNNIKTTINSHNDNTNDMYSKETQEDTQEYPSSHKDDVAVAVAIDEEVEAESDAAIGDIEDNFRNEDEVLPTVIDVGNDYGSSDVDKSVAVADAAAAAASATAQRSISVKEAKGQLAALTSIPAIVGRKMKRFNRVRTFNSGDRQHEPMQFDGVHYKMRHQNLMNDNGNSNNNNNDDDEHDVRNDKNWQQQQQERTIEMEHGPILQKDYAINSYGSGTSTRNGSNTFEDTQNASGQLGQHNGYAASASAAVSGIGLYEESPVRVKAESKHKAMRNEKQAPKPHQDEQSANRYHEQELEQEHDDEEQKESEPKLKLKLKQGQAQFAAKAMATATATATASTQSAFEEHKARRRNNRRYGHKSHKKRYKDYLRFAMTPLTTPATIAIPLATRNNTSEQNAIAAIATNTNGGTDPTKPAQPMDVMASSSLLAKLANNSERNYQKKHEIGMENVTAASGNVHAKKLRKYSRKLEEEKSRGLPASPIFVVGNRNVAMSARPNAAKPFYEGQINYYVETKDDEQSLALGAGNDDVSRNMNNGILPTDSSNWYRRVSPVLRNGIKSTLAEGNEPSNEHRRKHHHHHQHHHHHHQQHQPDEHEEDKHQHQSHNLLQHKHHHHQLQQQQQQLQDRAHQQHRNHHKHQQTNKHYQSAQSYPYQRKLVKKPPPPGYGAAGKLFSTPIPPPSYKPHAGAMQELGHQITEMEELERYYAKWPHLARVQLQVYDEHYRELHPELYPDYDQDYESAAELEEAQNANSEDANLPPYIKKYNRRNKQLLNLLEGTLPPPTRPSIFTQGHFSSLLQPGPHESSGGSRAIGTVRIDDDYMKEKRRRYHYRYGSGGSGNNNQNGGFQHDLFAQQRVVVNANDNTTKPEFPTVTQKSLTTTTTTTGMGTGTATSSSSLKTKGKTSKVMMEVATVQNQLPDEDVSITQEEQDEPDWQEEIETKSNGNDDGMTGNIQMSWQIEKLTTPSALSSASSSSSPPPKSALFRLPSYPAISGSYISKPRSRSAQFAPSRGGNTFINMHRDNYNFEKKRHMTTLTSTPPPPPPAPPAPATSSPPSPAPQSEYGSPSSVPNSNAKTINSFVYHRVVDSAPRFVGTGPTGLKQRLPFVAITDRRLETAKKTLMEHKKDLEQNFYPMP